MAADDGSGHDAPLHIWLAVLVIVAGCIMAGIALIEWVWPIFWVGVGLMVVGVLWAGLGGIMKYVSEFGPAHAQEIEQ